MSINRLASISKRTSLMAQVLAIACAGTVWVISPPRLTADESDKLTYLTFTAPVEVPGKVLQPGTYVFKLLDSASSRNIVEILDRDQKHLYATILAIPNYRMKPSDQTIVRFAERPSGEPEAIEAWFYPGDNYGQEFVYPHQRATELAKRTDHDVLSMTDQAGKEISTTATSANDPGIKAMQNTDVTGVNPSGGAVAISVIIATSPGK